MAGGSTAPGAIPLCRRRWFVLLAGVPVVIASQEHSESVGRQLGDAYVSEFYGLRPDVLLTVFIERGLWERFLGSR